MTRRMGTCLVLLAALGLFGACGDDPVGGARPARAVPHVYATIYPLAYFAERIGAEHVEVSCPLPDDADPIHWAPKGEVLREFQEDADLILVNGAELERWVQTVSLPRARVIDTSRGFKEQWIRFDTGVTHTHGSGDEHTHEGVDGNTWMDPLLALKQAQRIKDEFCLRWAKHADAFEQRFDALATDLRALDEAFGALGAQASGRWLMTTEPSYAYLARRRGWRVHDLGLTREPSESELAEISGQLEKTPAAFLLWNRAPDGQCADVFRGAVGLTSIVVTTCATRGGAKAAGGDYLEAMRANVKRLAPAFGAN